MGVSALAGLRQENPRHRQLLKGKMKTELTLRCACGVEHLDIDLYLELDEEDSYMSFSSIFGPRRSWRERFKAVWLILRGKNHYFNEIVLDPDKLTELRDFLIVNTTDGGRGGRSQAEIRADKLLTDLETMLTQRPVDREAVDRHKKHMLEEQ